jgi:hypothetical protein
VTDVPGALVKRYVTETILGCPLEILFAEAVALTAAAAALHHMQDTIHNIIKEIIIFFMVVSS